MTIDTTKPLEVVNTETGKTASAELARVESNWMIGVSSPVFENTKLYSTEGGCEIGTARLGLWRLRNIPEPETGNIHIPDAIQTEDGTVYKIAGRTFVLAEDYDELREFKRIALEAGYVPKEPVDPDLIEAGRINDWAPYELSELDERRAATVVQQVGEAILAGIKRGRELASQSPTKDNGNDE